MDNNDEGRNGAPAKGLNVSATPPLPPVDGRGPKYKDQVQQQQQQQQHSRLDPSPLQEEKQQRDGIVHDQPHAGPHFKDQARNVAPAAATSESPAARQTQQLPQQPSFSPPTDHLPLAAQVVDDVLDEQELEERIRRRILEGAAEAQVVTPSQLRRDSNNNWSCKNQNVVLYIVVGLAALLVAIVLGVVLPLTLTNDQTTLSPLALVDDSNSSSTRPPTTSATSLPNSISPRPTTSPAPTPSPPVPVTIEILLDSNPDETGWKIECGDDDPVAYANYPFRTYSPTQAMVTETVLVPAGASCRFTLSDAEGDGLYACCDENGDRLQEDRYFVYLGNSTAAQGNLVVAGSGDFGYETVHNFTATLLISLNTTTLPESTMSPRPTQSPAPTLTPTLADWNLLGDNGDCSVVGAESSLLCNDEFGWPAEISADGNVIAMTGIIDFTRILTLDEESNIWRQRGQDIQGFADDNREKYLALSGTGNVVAIGNTFILGSGLPGAVRVFRYNSQGNSWSQIGSTLDGLANVDEWFSPTSLSHNGNIIAVGERERYLGDGEPSFGRARAYRYNESAADWLQLGQDINGDEADDWFGNSVSLSNDGYVMAVGAPFYGSEANGQARIFHYNNTSNEWKLLGQPIEGAEESTELGWVVSMSGDGSTFAVGTYAGFVLVYRLDSTKSTWLQLGQKLTEQDTGTSNGGVFGISVTLSYDGSRLGIGNSAGPAVVLEYDNSSESWQQLGPAVYNRNSNETSSISVSISDDGRRIVVGGEFVSVFQKN